MSRFARTAKVIRRGSDYMLALGRGRTLDLPDEGKQVGGDTLPYVKGYWYNPTLQTGTIYNGSTPTSQYRYNHDVSVEWFDGRWWAAWNANPKDEENIEGQVNVIATSTDFINWSSPVAEFNSSTHSTNPFNFNAAADRQWQPNFLALPDRLLCVWNGFEGSTNYVCVSTRTIGGRWTHNRLNVLPVTVDGITYQGGFPTQDPIRLPSGRILAPIILISNSVAPDGSADPGVSSNYRAAAALISDDNGATWRLGGTAHNLTRLWSLWEPCFTLEPSGAVRMIVVNKNQFVPRPEYNLTAISLDEGSTWSQLQPMGLNTSVARMLVVNGGSENFREPKIMLHADYDGETGNSGDNLDRQSGALFLGSGANDFVPSINYPDPDVCRVPGMAHTYPQGRVKDGKIYVAYTLAENSFTSSSILCSIIDAVPQRGAVSPRGNAQIFKTPRFRTGPNRFQFGGRLQKFGSKVNTSGWANNRLSFYMICDSRKNLKNVLWDNRVGTSGCVIAQSISERPPEAHVPGDSKIYLRYYNGATLTNLDSGVSAPIYGGKYALAVVIDGVAQTLTTTLITADGTVTTNQVAIPVALSNLAGDLAYIGTSRAGSSLWAFLGDIYRVRVYQTALTAANIRSLYETDRGLLGMAAATGTQTAPAAPTLFLDCNDPNAGTNNATWTAAWDTLNVINGTVTRVAGGGRSNVMRIGGNASASFAPVSLNAGNNGVYQFAYWMPSGRTTNVGICTIGYPNDFIEVFKSTNQAQVQIRRPKRVMDSTLQSSITSASADPIADGRWYTVTVRFSVDAVTIEHQKMAPVTIPYRGKPVVFFGRAHDALGFGTQEASDFVLIDLDSIGYTESLPTDQPMLLKEWDEGAWTPTLNFGGATTGITYTTQNGFWRRQGNRVDWSLEILLSNKGTATGGATITGLPYASIAATGAVAVQGGSALFYRGFAASVTGAPMARVGGSIISLERPAAGDSVGMSDAEFTNASRLRLSGWYMTEDPMR